MPTAAEEIARNLNFVHLPRAEHLPQPEKTKGVTFLSLYTELHKPIIADALRSLAASTVISALLIDMFNTTAIDAAASLDISTYIFFTSSAGQLALMLYLPKIRPESLHDSKEKILVPGVTPVYPPDLPTPLLDPEDDEYKWFLYHCRRFPEAQGILVNTVDRLEPIALSDGRCSPGQPTPPVYPVGPLLNLEAQLTNSDRECLKWLDDQPMGSVIFLCFGNGGSFSGEQIQEIARGLELSDQRFVWSVRSPSSRRLKVSAHGDVDPIARLPAGFVDRTEGRGWVRAGRVPQVEILAHPATGGFVSHCGWNSVLESVWFGVPLIAWPLYAEQRMNAVQVVRDLEVGLGLEKDDDGLVKGEEFERVVRSLIAGEEGQRVRKKMRETKELVRKALENCGSSCINLTKVVAKWAEHC